MNKLFLLLFIFFTFPLWAEEQWVEMEWPEIAGASAYEIELYLDEGSGSRAGRGTYKTEKNNWSQKLDPGRYQFRIRSIDERQIPGEWSDLGSFVLHLPNPLLQKPLEKETIIADSEKQEIQFQWNPVETATSYYLEIWNKDGKGIYKAETPDTEQSVSLKISEDYFWRVVALNRSLKEIPSRDKGQSFSIKGGILSSPTISILQKEQKLGINWTSPPRATNFSYQLFRGGDDSAPKLIDRKHTKQQKLLLGTNNLSVSNYLFTIWAHSDQYEDSPANYLYFTWDGKGLSNIEQRSEQLYSSSGQKTDLFLDTRPRNYAFYANWDRLTLNYEGEVADTGTHPVAQLSSIRTSFDFFTINRNSFINWGLHYEKEDYQSTTQGKWNIWMFKADVQKYFSIGETWELGFHLGWFMKSYPYIYSGQEEGTAQNQEVKAMGPLIGMMVNKKVWEKWTFSFGPTLYISSLKMSTPNGEPLTASSNAPSLSLLINYSYDPMLQIKFGFSHESHRASFKSKSNTSSSNYARTEGDSLRIGFGLRF